MTSENQQRDDRFGQELRVAVAVGITAHVVVLRPRDYHAGGSRRIALLAIHVERDLFTICHCHSMNPTLCLKRGLHVNIAVVFSVAIPILKISLAVFKAGTGALLIGENGLLVLNITSRVDAALKAS